MKKTALTIGLFSLVIVATSFANPQTISTLDNNDFTIQNGKNNVSEGGGDVATGSNQGRKLDFHSSDNMSHNNYKQLEGFRQDRQSFGITKKID